ncbi:MAG: hypothetical protein EA381_10000 [Planctomycetaceae bacterium]|nr:MAG: hypothetical protein EA381_10000 [Planctomycetaceae bacterium]
MALSTSSFGTRPVSAVLMLDEIRKLRPAQSPEPVQPAPPTAGTGADVPTGLGNPTNQPPSGSVWFAF